MRPLCIDLYCGLGGWAEGFLSEGWRVIGFDIEAHDYGTGGYPGELVLRDVRSIHGSEFADAEIIVGSSPCQEFSYRAMPWKRAKALGPPYLGIELFQAQFRIQREVSEAAGKYVPMVVENVRGAQKWVGRARWHFGSYYLWGDVPALMPMTFKLKLKTVGPVTVHQAQEHNCHINEMRDATKIPGMNFSDFAKTGKVSPHWRMQLLAQREDAAKGNGSWFGDYKEAKAAGRGSANRYTSSNSLARKKASALIAKIPFPLAQHIARVFKPQVSEEKS